MSWRLFQLIAAIVGLVVIAFIGVRSQPASIKSDLDNTSVGRSSRSVSMITSSDAKEKVQLLIDGQMKAPSYGSAESHQFWVNRKAWLDALSEADCISLIESLEKLTEFHDLTSDLYRRLGEIEPSIALARIGAAPPELPNDPIRLAHLCASIQGWAQSDPQRAWDYYKHWETVSGKNPLRERGGATEIPQYVFASWVTKDTKSAYEALVELELKSDRFTEEQRSTILSAIQKRLVAVKSN